uniref:Ubiquitin carboxyl-terminal hydrolase, putative n=2 Tax=Neospora caninum (strain Liverpool) TaxID=572307 RepID=A0A0F7U8F7_NEOCL|nr:TPA: ubiquitin carboxyl-terminal hydrolase, putative [Neospora caninum Liverpool]
MHAEGRSPRQMPSASAEQQRFWSSFCTAGPGAQLPYNAETHPGHPFAYAAARVPDPSGVDASFVPPQLARADGGNCGSLPDVSAAAYPAFACAAPAPRYEAPPPAGASRAGEDGHSLSHGGAWTTQGGPVYPGDSGTFWFALSRQSAGTGQALPSQAVQGSVSLRDAAAAFGSHPFPGQDTSSEGLSHVPANESTAPPYLSGGAGPAPAFGCSRDPSAGANSGFLPPSQDPSRTCFRQEDAARLFSIAGDSASTTSTRRSREPLSTSRAGPASRDAGSAVSESRRGEEHCQPPSLPFAGTAGGPWDTARAAGHALSGRLGGGGKDGESGVYVHPGESDRGASGAFKLSHVPETRFSEPVMPACVDTRHGFIAHSDDLVNGAERTNVIQRQRAIPDAGHQRGDHASAVHTADAVPTGDRSTWHANTPVPASFVHPPVVVHAHTDSSFQHVPAGDWSRNGSSKTPDAPSLHAANTLANPAPCAHVNAEAPCQATATVCRAPSWDERRTASLPARSEEGGLEASAAPKKRRRVKKAASTTPSQTGVSADSGEREATAPTAKPKRMRPASSGVAPQSHPQLQAEVLSFSPSEDTPEKGTEKARQEAAPERSGGTALGWPPSRQGGCLGREDLGRPDGIGLSSSQERSDSRVQRPDAAAANQEVAASTTACSSVQRSQCVSPGDALGQTTCAASPSFSVSSGVKIPSSAGVSLPSLSPSSVAHPLASTPSSFPPLSASSKVSDSDPGPGPEGDCPSAGLLNDASRGAPEAAGPCPASLPASPSGQRLSGAPAELPPPRSRPRPRPRNLFGTGRRPGRQQGRQQRRPTEDFGAEKGTAFKGPDASGAPGAATCSRSPSVNARSVQTCVVLGYGTAMPDREVTGTSLVGLINLGGGSCFLNAVLQCLANFRPLRDFYLQWAETLPPRELLGRQYAVYTKQLERLAPFSRRRVKRRQQEKAASVCTSISWELATVINYMWRLSGSVKFLKPDALYQACCRIMPDFDPHEMQDSDEFLRLLLDILDAELRAAVLQVPLQDVLLLQRRPTKWESDDRALCPAARDCAGALPPSDASASAASRASPPTLASTSYAASAPPTASPVRCSSPASISPSVQGARLSGASDLCREATPQSPNLSLPPSASDAAAPGASVSAASGLRQAFQEADPAKATHATRSGEAASPRLEVGAASTSGASACQQAEAEKSERSEGGQKASKVSSSTVDAVQTLFSLVFEGGEVDEVWCSACGRRTATLVPFKSLAVAMTQEAQEQACYYSSLRAKPATFSSELIPVDLVECLDRHFADDADSLKLSTGEGYYCSRCQRKQDAVKRCCLVKDHLPFVLCLTLKRFVRGHDTYKIWNPVRFGEFLDLSKYVRADAFPAPDAAEKNLAGAEWADGGARNDGHATQPEARDSLDVKRASGAPEADPAQTGEVLRAAGDLPACSDSGGAGVPRTASSAGWLGATDAPHPSRSLPGCAGSVCLASPEGSAAFRASLSGFPRSLRDAETSTMASLNANNGASRGEEGSGVKEETKDSWSAVSRELHGPEKKSEKHEQGGPGDLGSPVKSERAAGTGGDSASPTASSASSLYRYCLVALIEHEGPATDQGHYVCYVKHLETGQWFKADDKLITLVDFETQVLAAAPYMLFYERVPSSETTQAYPFFAKDEADGAGVGSAQKKESQAEGDEESPCDASLCAGGRGGRTWRRCDWSAWTQRVKEIPVACELFGEDDSGEPSSSCTRQPSPERSVGADSDPRGLSPASSMSAGSVRRSRDCPVDGAPSPAGLARSSHTVPGRTGARAAPTGRSSQKAGEGTGAGRSRLAASGGSFASAPAAAHVAPLFGADGGGAARGKNGTEPVKGGDVAESQVRRRDRTSVRDAETLKRAGVAASAQEADGTRSGECTLRRGKRTVFMAPRRLSLFVSVRCLQRAPFSPTRPPLSPSVPSGRSQETQRPQTPASRDRRQGGATAPDLARLPPQGASDFSPFGSAGSVPAPCGKTQEVREESRAQSRPPGPRARRDAAAAGVEAPEDTAGADPARGIQARAVPDVRMQAEAPLANLEVANFRPRDGGEGNQGEAYQSRQPRAGAVLGDKTSEAAGFPGRESVFGMGRGSPVKDEATRAGPSAETEEKDDACITSATGATTSPANTSGVSSSSPGSSPIKAESENAFTTEAGGPAPRPTFVSTSSPTPPGNHPQPSSDAPLPYVDARVASPAASPQTPPYWAGVPLSGPSSVSSAFFLRGDASKKAGNSALVASAPRFPEEGDTVFHPKHDSLREDLTPALTPPRISVSVSASGVSAPGRPMLGEPQHMRAGTLTGDSWKGAVAPYPSQPLSVWSPLGVQESGMPPYPRVDGAHRISDACPPRLVEDAARGRQAELQGAGGDHASAQSVGPEAPLRGPRERTPARGTEGVGPVSEQSCGATSWHEVGDRTHVERSPCGAYGMQSANAGRPADGVASDRAEKAAQAAGAPAQSPAQSVSQDAPSAGTVATAEDDAEAAAKAAAAKAAERRRRARQQQQNRRQRKAEAAAAKAQAGAPGPSECGAGEAVPPGPGLGSSAPRGPLPAAPVGPGEFQPHHVQNGPMYAGASYPGWQAQMGHPVAGPYQDSFAGNLPTGGALSHGLSGQACRAGGQHLGSAAYPWPGHGKFYTQGVLRTHGGQPTQMLHAGQWNASVSVAAAASQEAAAAAATDAGAPVELAREAAATPPRRRKRTAAPSPEQAGSRGEGPPQVAAGVSQPGGVWNHLPQERGMSGGSALQPLARNESAEPGRGTGTFGGNLPSPHPPGVSVDYRELTQVSVHPGVPELGASPRDPRCAPFPVQVHGSGDPQSFAGPSPGVPAAEQPRASLGGAEVAASQKKPPRRRGPAANKVAARPQAQADGASISAQATACTGAAGGDANPGAFPHSAQHLGNRADRFTETFPNFSRSPWSPPQTLDSAAAARDMHTSQGVSNQAALPPNVQQASAATVGYRDGPLAQARPPQPAAPVSGSQGFASGVCTQCGRLATATEPGVHPSCTCAARLFPTASCDGFGAPQSVASAGCPPWAGPSFPGDRNPPVELASRQAPHAASRDERVTQPVSAFAGTLQSSQKTQLEYPNSQYGWPPCAPPGRGADPTEAGFVPTPFFGEPSSSQAEPSVGASGVTAQQTGAAWGHTPTAAGQCLPNSSSRGPDGVRAEPKKRSRKKKASGQEAASVPHGSQAPGPATHSDGFEANVASRLDAASRTSNTAFQEGSLAVPRPKCRTAKSVKPADPVAHEPSPHVYSDEQNLQRQLSQVVHPAAPSAPYPGQNEKFPDRVGRGDGDRRDASSPATPDQPWEGGSFLGFQNPVDSVSPAKGTGPQEPFARGQPEGQNYAWGWTGTCVGDTRHQTSFHGVSRPAMVQAYGSGVSQVMPSTVSASRDVRVHVENNVGFSRPSPTGMAGSSANSECAYHHGATVTHAHDSGEAILQQQQQAVYAGFAIPRAQHVLQEEAPRQYCPGMQVSGPAMSHSGLPAFHAMQAANCDNVPDPGWLGSAAANHPEGAGAGMVCVAAPFPHGICAQQYPPGAVPGDFYQSGYKSSEGFFSDGAGDRLRTRPP